MWSEMWGDVEGSGVIVRAFNRVEAMRERVQRKLTALSNLENQVKSERFRAQLQHPRNQLNDVHVMLAEVGRESPFQKYGPSVDCLLDHQSA